MESLVFGFHVASPVNEVKRSWPGVLSLTRFSPFRSGELHLVPPLRLDRRPSGTRLLGPNQRPVSNPLDEVPLVSFL